MIFAHSIAQAALVVVWWFLVRALRRHFEAGLPPEFAARWRWTRATIRNQVRLRGRR